jgi:hypothetical protein
MFYGMELEFVFTRARYRRPARNGDGIIVLSPARKISLANPGRGNSAKIGGE